MQCVQCENIQYDSCFNALNARKNFTTLKVHNAMDCKGNFVNKLNLNAIGKAEKFVTTNCRDEQSNIGLQSQIASYIAK